MSSSIGSRTRRWVPHLLLLGLGLLALALFPRAAARAQSTGAVVDDFESYQEDHPPTRWKYISKDQDVLPISAQTNQREQFSVVREDGNQFVRAYTKGEALRFTQRNGKEFSWNVNEQPYLQWQWRANRLPEDASETGDNDTGGAVYVTFGSDWLGRPKSIKYTYSSSLPVGTTVDFGPLKALVVASGTERTGAWRTETRNVVQDYRNLFGDDPPSEPLSITLWSDSDSTGDTAEVDFDDIRLLAQP